MSTYDCTTHELDPCPDCDTDTIQCRECGRKLEIGESAWADDVKVITPDGVRLETRYTCDACGVTQ